MESSTSIQHSNSYTESDTSPDDMITHNYTERFTLFKKNELSGKDECENVSKKHVIQTEKKVPKLGVMLVGLGGNNGSTFVAGILANKYNVEWESK